MIMLQSTKHMYTPAPKRRRRDVDEVCLERDQGDQTERSTKSCRVSTRSKVLNPVDMIRC
jgi:hypothetical protein